MDTTSQYFILGLIIAFVLHRARSYLWTKPTLLRGPPRNSWLLGHEGVLRSQTNVCELEERWTQEYGTIFRVGGFYGHDTLVVSDGKALQHIFTLTDRYPKGADEERFLRALFGPGLVTVGRSVHRRQRHIINPAFAAPQLRAFMEALHISGAKMVDKIKSEIERDNSSIINVMDWMTRIAIDVLGISTFRHEFGALDGRKEAIMVSEMHRAAIQEASTDPSLLETLVMSLMRVLPPWTTSLFALLPTTENRKLIKFRSFSRNFASSIMKSVLLDEDEAGTKDVVGLLLAAGQETKDPAKKMSENEVLAQISTVLAAGEDTTSITMAFLLYELARHPEDQERVREEISVMYATKLQNGGSFKAKDYDDLPFLNAVIKETLRLYPNIHTLARRASQDDVLPLAEAVMLANGASTKTVPIAKGQNLLMSMRTYNRLPSAWGSDSNTWNPLRFLAERNQQTTVGLYANLISFSAGPQGCIGWQFAVAELQVLTVLMVRHFKLHTTVSIREVQSLFSIYPAIEGKEAEGHQLPLELCAIL